MEIAEKLRILSAAAKYDVSCSSSGGNRKNTEGGIGNSFKAGLCHSFSSDGRCISLLKVLLTNYCSYDCAYCVNRMSNDIERAAFTPEEAAELTINFYRRNYIEGLFLSSAVFRNPNYTMELLIKTVKILREEYRFNGYIHLKAIPGADERLIHRAGLYADRMSVNIELPTREGLKLLAPQKKQESIFTPMKSIKDNIILYKKENSIYKNSPKFVPAGQSTQLIIGATPDSDLSIMKLAESLYSDYKLRRVYYSAYVPVPDSPKLNGVLRAPLIREHRLYQADWLLRFYGFSAKELLDEDNPNLNINMDPKADWAIRNIERFPVEINKAPLMSLIRVPGIGLKSAEKIIEVRRVSNLSFDDIKKIGVVIKRAKYFITCNGKWKGETTFREALLKDRLSLGFQENMTEQLGFFQNGS
jgi:putative DNA modification/repair radical SAM protein